jgi:peroxiredoxin Q/BCP
MSGDTAEDLAKFRDKYSLNFPLLGDAGHRVLEAYGVWQEKYMYGKRSMGVARTTYFIGADGRVTHVFPKVKVDGHLQEVLAALRT